MKNDTEIRIGGQQWSIQLVSQIDKLSDKYGLCNFDELTIYMRQGRKPDAMADTLIHEILHVLLYQSGIDSSVIGNVINEELIVQSLANGLLQLLRDNPLIFSYIIFGPDEKPKRKRKRSRKSGVSKH